MFEDLLKQAIIQAEKTGLTGPEKKEWVKKWARENIENLDNHLGAWVDFPLVDWLQDWALGLAVEFLWGKLTSMNELKGAQQ